MTALAVDRNTKTRDGLQFEFPMAAAKKIFAGALVGLDTTTGLAAPMTSANTWKVVGIAEELADNSAGAASAINVKVRRGCVLLVNGDTITNASVGATAYADDDQTVFKAAGTRSVVGTIRSVDIAGGGVWVQI
jgi:hypothetical protein